MLQLVPNSAPVQTVVTALIGSPVHPSRRTRGVYARFPTPPPYPPIQNGIHWDSCRHQLGAMVLLEDCPPTGGCFTLWPASHHKLFPLFTTSQSNFPKDITNFAILDPGGMSPLTQQICGRIGQSKSAEWRPSPSALGVAQRPDPATALPTLSSDYLNSIISHVCSDPFSAHNCYRYAPAAGAQTPACTRSKAAA